MAKVEFDPGIESVRGILMGTDPFYIRRYPQRGGGVMHIVQARPDRSPPRVRPESRSQRSTGGRSTWRFWNGNIATNFLFHSRKKNSG